MINHMDKVCRLCIMVEVLKVNLNMGRRMALENISGPTIHNIKVIGKIISLRVMDNICGLMVENMLVSGNKVK